MTELPSQSHASREPREPREVQPVIRGTGRIRKTPMGRRLRENFFQAGAREVWASMFWDVFMQGIRDNISDSVHEGVDTLFRGQGGGAGYRRPGHIRNRGTSIMVGRHNPDRALGGTPERISKEDRSRQNTGVIEIDSRAEAEAVLEAMNATIDQYDIVTLAEFYQLVRISPEHTDYKWGWEDLGGAHVVHSRGAYYLDLPAPIPLR